MTTSNPPSMARRFSASIYEFALLFGIYFVTGALTQVALILVGLKTPIWFLQAIVFIVLGLYFSHSWQKAGQTLAQRTWHIKIIGTNNQLPTRQQAWLRYIFSYLGVFPALLMLFTLTKGQLTQENFSQFFVQIIVFLLINWLTLLGTSFMNPQRRAIHEVLSGTRSIYAKKD